MPPKKANLNTHTVDALTLWIVFILRGLGENRRYTTSKRGIDNATSFLLPPISVTGHIDYRGFLYVADEKPLKMAEETNGVYGKEKQGTTW